MHVNLFLAVDVSLLDESLSFAVACLENNCKTTKSFGVQPAPKCGYGPRQLQKQ